MLPRLGLSLLLCSLLFLWVLFLLFTATLVSFISLRVVRVVTSFADVVLRIIQSFLFQTTVLDSTARLIIFISLFIPFLLVLVVFYEVH